MPQLDFVIYSYQFLLLFITFFLLYDLILNYWLPAFLGGHYLIKRLNSDFEVLSSYFNRLGKLNLFTVLRKLFRIF